MTKDFHCMTEEAPPHKAGANCVGHNMYTHPRYHLYHKEAQTPTEAGCESLYFHSDYEQNPNQNPYIPHLCKGKSICSNPSELATVETNRLSILFACGPLLT